MFGWIVFIIVIVIMCITFLLGLVITRKIKKLRRNDVFVVDLKMYVNHGILNFFRGRITMMNKNKYVSANSNERVIKEKSFTKREHVIDINDSIELRDQHSGGQIIINCLSALNIIVKQKIEHLLYRIVVLESENAQLRSELMDLRANMDQKVSTRLDELGKMIDVSTRPWMINNKNRGGNTHGRN